MERDGRVHEKGIESYMLRPETNKWHRFGFLHDPVLSMFADVYGFDKDDVPQKDWLEYSNNTYPMM